jgi:hypothetical protein
MELVKEIRFYYNGRQVFAPVLPFISGRKKRELEAIIPKYFQKAAEIFPEVNPENADAAIANRAMNVNYEYLNLAAEEVQKKSYDICLAMFREQITHDFIAAMIDIEKIDDKKHKGLKECINTEYDNDFWLDQDTIYLNELADSFRKIIK